MNWFSTMAVGSATPPGNGSRRISLQAWGANPTPPTEVAGGHIEPVMAPYRHGLAWSGPHPKSPTTNQLDRSVDYSQVRNKENLASCRRMPRRKFFHAQERARRSRKNSRLKSYSYISLAQHCFHQCFRFDLPHCGISSGHAGCRAVPIGSISRPDVLSPEQPGLCHWPM